MKPYIQETINDINRKIATLEEMVRTLATLDTVPGDQVAPLPVPANGNGQAVAVTLKAAPRVVRKAAALAAPAARKQVTVRNRGQATVNAISGCRSLREPFTNGDLAARLGTNNKNAANYTTRWKAKGWLVGDGCGLYHRTPKFPSDVSAQSNSILAEIHKEIATAPEQ